MDADRFDALARNLGAARSRRWVVRALVGAALVGIGGGRAATAAPRCRIAADCPQDRDPCVATVCDETRTCAKVPVVDGTGCGRGSLCFSGRCLACQEFDEFGVRFKACPSPNTPGGSTCVDVLRDRRNCGGCGRTCRRGTECVQGACCRRERICETANRSRRICCARPCVRGVCER